MKSSKVVSALVVIALVIAIGAMGGRAADAATPTVGLGTAASFAVLAGSAITNTGLSVINGDLGSSPTPAITGFPPGTVNGAKQPVDAVMQSAKADLVIAYNDAAGRTPTIPVVADLGGQTLAPGVYNSASSLGLTGVLTLSGTSSDVWIFQAGSTLTTASGSSVVLSGGAQSCNVFWQVGSSATLGTGTTLRGSILALTSITVTTGTTIDGRALARNGAVTLDTNTITRSTCAAPPATQVTLNCNDGTTWTAIVDTDTLASLVASVQAMLDYPAGLTCTLLQTPVVLFGDIAVASAGGNPFVVGGGRWQLPCERGGSIDGGVVAQVPGTWDSVQASSTALVVDDQFFWVNVAVNVHQRDDGTFFGLLNETIPANQCLGTVPESHFSSTGPNNEICMTLPTTDTSGFVTTFVTGRVTQTSGAPFTGPYVHFGFLDSGTPPGQNTTPTPGTPGNTDRLNGPPMGNQDATAGCTGQTGPAPAFNLGTNDFTKQNGNISVRNAP